ncbi:hypothetical protein ENBRE01_1447 [Enteropsectra breve]|nr:hypothetical protein ENBRE01_1447 [Enteropsectra breve]
MNVALGEPGIIYQIDESKMNYKTKYNVGKRSKDIWVFGIVDTPITPGKAFVQIVEKRDAETLFPIIQAKCLLGTIIHSDQWAAYCKIQDNNNKQFIHRSPLKEKKYKKPLRLP